MRDDARLAPAPVVGDLARAIETEAIGLYVAGSLASGDYRPGISDIDAVALLESPPNPATRAELVKIHSRLVAEHEHGHALHCVYLPASDTVDADRKHWNWAFDELFRRPLSLIARAELLADPVVVLGPHPSTWLAPMGMTDLQDAARAELAGYWSRALRKRAIWLQDVYVDLGLTVWARADATISEGALITKSEAITRMRERGLPPDLVDGVADRRAGRTTTLSDEQRQQRAVTVRQFLSDEFSRLLAQDRDDSKSGS